ncbi:hypothetical protein [Streptomyces sp. NPDC048001]|uniref:hypothetical protein n=1 Tax=Streptomyces sp. NPDC048001 TaxID=3365498 RepID=UPI00371CE62A
MSSTQDTHESTRRRRSRLAVASVAVAVLVAGGGGAWLASGGSDGAGAPSGAEAETRAGEPAPLLALDGAGGDPGSIAPGEPDPNGGGVVYRPEGELPEGPERAAVQRASGSVTEAEVSRLAEALGLAGPPELAGQVWKIGSDKDGSGPVLQVDRQAPGTWTFARFGPNPGGDNCLKGKECPSGGPSADGPREPGPAVGEEEAERAAAPVLEAVGQGDARLRSDQLMGAVRVVNADPVVDGLPTYGWSTGVQVGADGQVVGGSGHLKEPVRSHSYPVVSADEAVKALNEEGRGSGRVGIGGCATPVPHQDDLPADPGLPQRPCDPASATTKAAPEVLTITEAEFGLAAQLVDGRQALVPSWLFRVEPENAGDEGGAAFTVARTAVDPAYVKGPQPPGEGGDPEPPGGSDELPPVPGTSYRASGDGRTLTVNFWGGVCDAYAAEATETADTVSVEITVPNPDPARVCIALAEEQSVTVTLREPLGDRRVVDAASGEVLPRQG